MSFFKIKTCWSNAELIVLKLCIASAYILVGGYFHSFFHHYDVLILVLFSITCVWSVYLWISKMKGVK
jgi:flagellar motor component MotA